MHVTTVASATLARIAYDASRRLLHLEFRDQTVYQYVGVPAEVYHALLRAPSKGRFFNRAIRGHFPHVSRPTIGEPLY
jgi:hypothetical protein